MHIFIRKVIPNFRRWINIHFYPYPSVETLSERHLHCLPPASRLSSIIAEDIKDHSSCLWSTGILNRLPSCRQADPSSTLDARKGLGRTCGRQYSEAVAEMVGRCKEPQASATEPVLHPRRPSSKRDSTPHLLRCLGVSLWMRCLPSVFVQDGWSSMCLCYVQV